MTSTSRRTVAEWAELNGLPLHVAVARISGSWDATEAVTMSIADARRRAIERNRVTASPKPRPNARKRGFAPQLYLHDGLNLSLPDWSIRSGVKVHTLRDRLARGMSFEDALQQVEPRSAPSTLTYKGETLSISEWSTRTGINQATIRQRLEKGWPMADVFSSNDNRRKTGRRPVRSVPFTTEASGGWGITVITHNDASIITRL